MVLNLIMLCTEVVLHLATDDIIRHIQTSPKTDQIDCTSCIYMYLCMGHITCIIYRGMFWLDSSGKVGVPRIWSAINLFYLDTDKPLYLVYDWVFVISECIQHCTLYIKWSSQCAIINQLTMSSLCGLNDTPPLLYVFCLE